MFAKLFFQMPFPVGYGAISNSKPDTQNKPTDCGYNYANEMQLSHGFPYPAKQVKADNGEMQQR